MPWSMFQVQHKLILLTTILHILCHYMKLAKYPYNTMCTHFMYILLCILMKVFEVNESGFIFHTRYQEIDENMYFFVIICRQGHP